MSGRFQRWHLLGAALLLGISCRGAAQTAAPAAAPPPEPEAVAERVRVFLIAPGDGGRAGRQVACGDSAVPVEVALARPQPAMAGALGALLAMGERRERFDSASGLLNQLYASRLALAGVERRGAQAWVRLTGYVELGDDCDDARMLAQLTATALQYRGISDVQFELDGQPLGALLRRGGAAAGPRPQEPAGVPPPAAAPPASPPAPDVTGGR